MDGERKNEGERGEDGGAIEFRSYHNWSRDDRSRIVEAHYMRIHHTVIKLNVNICESYIIRI